MRRLAATFFLLYIVVMGVSPALRYWSSSRTIIGWQMFSGRPRELPATITIHYGGGRTEDLVMAPGDRRTHLSTSDRVVASLPFGADAVRFAPPHLCAAIDGALTVTGRTSIGREIRFSCPR